MDMQSMSEIKVTVDGINKQMKPQQFVSQVQLMEPAGTTQTARLAAHYTVTGDMISLPYTEQPLVKQLMATRSEFVNPFAVFTWDGFVNVTPQRDNWVENLKNVLTISLKHSLTP